MKFEPLYYSDRIRIVNPFGDVGIVTLWTPVKQALKTLGSLNIDLSPASSRIAVIANLYGNGLPQMLRNLLWNPQVRHLLVIGQNLSGSREELVNFFQNGIERVEYLGTPAFRIIDTLRIIDGLVNPSDFRNDIRVTPLGKLSDNETKEGIIDFFKTLPAPGLQSIERRNIPIHKTEVSRFPSEPRSHSILRDTPLEAWKELIYHVVRFGHPVTLKKGRRLELQNMKVVIANPCLETTEELQSYGFSLSHFQEYQRQILNPCLSERLSEQSYTYGNRIRGYYHYHGQVIDSLAIVIQRLRDDRETRHAYVSLWDNSRDLPEGRQCPCMVSLFFRYFDGRLTLTATFRTHNAMNAWLENVYGLMAIQEYVANELSMPLGAIIVQSHSITVSDDVLELAKQITINQVKERSQEREPRYDHYGNFAVTVDHVSHEIVAQHTYQGAVIAEYRGATAISIERQLIQDEALSDISHALYLGRELARQEMLLKQVTYD